MRKEQDRQLRAGYRRIPDHSDLRGFSYRAPYNYRWSDDHPATSHAGKGPKGYRRPDERIRDDVCEALKRHPGIDAGEMNVNVQDGIVTLSGSAADRWSRRASEWVSSRVSGVKDVKNELALRKHFNPQEQRRFQEIRAREITYGGPFPA